MAWITPITVVTGDILSAAQYNQSVRDNLLEMAPAKATGRGNLFSASGMHQIMERDVNSSVVNDSESTTSTSYVDLATVGPSVTVNCQYAIVFLSARMRNVSADGKGAYISVAISGSTTYPASDDQCASSAGVLHNNPNRIGIQFGVFCNSGTNTFTMKYRAQSGAANATFEQRELVVIPL